MEKIRLKKLINRYNDEQNFIYLTMEKLSQEFSSNTFADDTFWTTFSEFYQGHSGNKFLGGLGYTTLDGFSLVDDDGYDVSIALSSGEESGIINDWDTFSEDLSMALCYQFARKWIAVSDTIEKNYRADIDEDEKYTETLTNNLKDEKSYGRTNETRRGSKVSSTDSVITTESTTPYNSSTFQDINKTTSSSDTTTTAEADSNVTNSQDGGADTTSHTGTRTREVVRTGGSDKWRRGQEFFSLISSALFETMARDIDSVVTLPFYSLQ